MIKNISKRKLNRGSTHRFATLKNLASNLIRYEMIKTTDAKAKELKRFVEHLITKIKNSSLEVNKYRIANKYLTTKSVAEKLIKIILPRYTETKGGYTKSAILGNRKGDNACIVIVKFK